MKCPTCQHLGTRVLDSRPVDEGKSIRRRRECESCQFRFT
ncbi:transcriptional regulator NrdR, partial [Bacillus altitudinis]|nr:transcriptional regulator NrdR [Bacillus altitudinis]